MKTLSIRIFAFSIVAVAFALTPLLGNAAPIPLFSINTVSNLPEGPSVGADAAGHDIVFSFTLNGSYQVSALGLINTTVSHPGVGPFVNTHSVGLFDSSNQQLASVTFSPSTPGTAGPGAPASAALLANFQYQNVVPLILSAGNYKLISSYSLQVFPGPIDGQLSSTISLLNSTSASNFSGLKSSTIQPGVFISPSTPSFPNQAYLSGNLLLETVASVPVPSAIVLLMIGLASMSLRRNTRFTNH
jgi:hypothetical protein